MPGWQAADLDGGPHPLVLVGRRHAHVDDREVGLVLGDDGEQRLGIADASEHRVPGVLQQPCEPLAQEHGVLGDHESHGIATSMRVPSPLRADDLERPAVGGDAVLEPGEARSRGGRPRRRRRRRRR